MDDIKQLIEQQGQAWNEFKKQNDERIAKLEKGRGVADLEANLENINAALGELKSAQKAIETKSGRIGRAGDEGDNEYKAAFDAFIRKGDESALRTKSVTTTNDADGGYAVPEGLDRSILELLRAETPMRQVAGSITISTDEYKKLVNLGGAASGWVGEEAARPTTTGPQLAQIAAFMGEIYANPNATQKSLDDIFFNTEAWISSEVVQEFTEQENLAFTSGNGTNKPKGFLAYTTAATGDAARAFGTLQHVVTGQAAAITTDSLIDLIYSARKGYRRNGSFMLNGLTTAVLRKLKNSDGDYIWQQSLQLGEPDRLLGYGVVENDDMPDIAAGSLPIAFGDFKRGYLVVDRMGVRMLRDPYTNKPFVQFYTTKRVGGGVIDSNALKLLKVSA